MIIGITGHARHGKDTVALMMQKGYLCSYNICALAYPMKKACSEMFGWSLSYIETCKDIIDPRWGISPRQVLVLLGTEFAQEMLSNKYPQYKEQTGRALWVRRLLNKYPDNVIIPDVRFVHEEMEIHKRGGIIIRVERPEYPVNLDHESERQVLLIQHDKLIINDGSLDDLQAATLMTIHELGI